MIDDDLSVWPNTCLQQELQQRGCQKGDPSGAIPLVVKCSRRVGILWGGALIV